MTTVAQPFAHRVALVTGASGGIGRSLAIAVARAGASVGLVFLAHESAAVTLTSRIVAEGGHAIAVRADLRDPAAPAQIVDTVENSLGPVDVLVSNAGIAGVSQQLDAITPDELAEVMAVNFRAPFLLAQRTLPQMENRRFGRVLFVSSVAAFAGGFVGPHYCASKAALHGLMHSLAPRAAPFGVTVNTLAPGRIAGTGLAQPRLMSEGVPVGRPGHVEEVADMALAVLRNPYVTNKVISVDGGIYPR